MYQLILLVKMKTLFLVDTSLFSMDNGQIEVTQMQNNM